MTLRCPVCRAENAAGPICRRCRADLSLLAAVEARRDHHLAAARTAVADSRFDDAVEELVRAAELRHGSDIHRLRACAFLLAGDFASARSEYAVAAP
jgi:Flp pilus assembly protein TadD